MFDSFSESSWGGMGVKGSRDITCRILLWRWYLPVSVWLVEMEVVGYLSYRKWKNHPIWMMCCPTLPKKCVFFRIVLWRSTLCVRSEGKAEIGWGTQIKWTLPSSAWFVFAGWGGEVEPDCKSQIVNHMVLLYCGLGTLPIGVSGCWLLSLPVTGCQLQDAGYFPFAGWET